MTPPDAGRTQITASGSSDPAAASAVPSAAEVSRLAEAVTRLSVRLEAFNLADLLEVSKRPWKLVWTNFIAGLARGVGMFLGAGIAGTIVLGLATWFLYHALEVAEMIPVINQLTQIATDFVKQFLATHPPKK
jgi:hypothetical protein